jgi:hypothetical protein
LPVGERITLHLPGPSPEIEIESIELRAPPQRPDGIDQNSSPR